MQVVPDHFLGVIAKILEGILSLQKSTASTGLADRSKIEKIHGDYWTKKYAIWRHFVGVIVNILEGKCTRASGPKPFPRRHCGNIRLDLASKHGLLSPPLLM